MSFKSMINIAGWLVFAIAAIVLGMSAEPTGSLWDCGEFIAGAYKLQVVHPPGAPMFLLVGRMFAWVGSLISDDPQMIAYMVNLLSALCTAFGAMFVCWSTIYLTKILLVGRSGEGDLDDGQKIAVAGAGLVAGLTTAFLPSIWFSASEGEVYAMSFFFTCLTVWAVVKWYYLPDNARTDRWLVFAIYASGLSIGVHLLSLLTFPALALFYYFKKAEKPTFLGSLLAALGGTFFIGIVQTAIIVGIPSLWASFDKTMVNSFGMPFNSGLIPVILIYGGITYLILRYAHKRKSGLIQKVGMAFAVLSIAYSCYGTVVIRANANPPINMNNPSDPMRLLPYLNREQYGERPLLRGPNFDGKLENYEFTDRYGIVGDRYEIVDQKIDPIYRNSDKIFFPRMSDYSQNRPAVYRQWVGKQNGSMTVGDNMYFFFRYQIGWMYWRYFMWNFAGRQSGEQGYFDQDPSSGNWLSGIDFYDEMRLVKQDKLPDVMRNDKARNTYYMIPFLLGVVGLFFHYLRRPKEFAALLALFIITGIGITVYSNQPPNEPRERDYVLVGSFFVFAMWIGMSVVAIFEVLKKYGLKGAVGGGLSVAVGLLVPFLLVTQNMDDYSRAGHYGARDYASNFLNSCEENAIIFTYGDNDTYPLWYAQEVEGIRTDVRVVNLSLIAVDWYIEQLRRKVNKSEPIKLSISPEQYRGMKRVQIPFFGGNPSIDPNNQTMDLSSLIKFIGEDHELPTQGGQNFDSYVPAKNVILPVNKAKIVSSGYLPAADSSKIVDAISFTIAAKDKTYIQKDELAILDLINSNAWERPIYWAVTCREEKLMGLRDYLQLEGLSLRLVPIKSQSERGLGMVGSGRVATDLAYENIMEKWRWGGFDKHETFINTSYMPSVQTMRISFIRTAQAMMGQDKEKAVALVDKYFEAFPHMNFAYDYFTTYLVDLYVRAGANDKAKDTMRILIQEAKQHMEFFESIDPNDLRAGYEQDQQLWVRTISDMYRLSAQIRDEAFMTELDTELGRWKPQLPGGPGAEIQ